MSESRQQEASHRTSPKCPDRPIQIHPARRVQLRVVDHQRPTPEQANEAQIAIAISHTTATPTASLCPPQRHFHVHPLAVPFTPIRILNVHSCRGATTYRMDPGVWEMVGCMGRSWRCSGSYLVDGYYQCFGLQRTLIPSHLLHCTWLGQIVPTCDSLFSADFWVNTGLWHQHRSDYPSIS